MEIMYVYTKQRREFGRSAEFADRPAELEDELPPNVESAAAWIERFPLHVDVQTAPEMSEHEVNTELKDMKNQGMLHVEGGWPKDVDPNEVEHVIRFRKKVEKDEDYVRSIKALGSVVDHCVRSNNSVDIFEDYFSGQAVDHSSEPPSAKMLTVFRDPDGMNRGATSMSWSPDGPKKLAVSYSVLQFQQMKDDMSFSSYIWDVENPNAPDQTIIPSSPLCSISYSPKDPHILVGGSYNGLIAYWDTRKGSYAVDTSLIEHSHRDPVYSVKWIASKTGTECFSVSTDGQVCWWDIRKLGEPTETMMLDVPDADGGRSILVGGCTLDYETTLPTKFMVGTEQGIVLNCNRKNKAKGGTAKGGNAKGGAGDRITNVYRGHHGPITSLQRNPFFTKYFLTVGDWTTRIWQEDIRSPIMTSKYHMSYLTNGCWSPSRPGVFLTTKMDGTLDVWDYMYKQNDPTLTLRVADTGLNSAAVQDQGKLVAVGAADGSCTLLELCDGLSVIQPNEKVSIQQMFDRETKREKNLESRAKELRLKEKKRSETPSAADNNDAVPNDLKEIELAFFEAVKKAEKELAANERNIDSKRSAAAALTPGMASAS